MFLDVYGQSLLKLRTSGLRCSKYQSLFNVCFIFVRVTFAEVQVIVHQIFLTGFALAVGSRKIKTTIADSFKSESRAYKLFFGGNIRILQNLII